MVYRFIDIVIGCVSLLLSGLTGFKLWGWFVAPLGLPAITYWQSVGLLIMLAFITGASFFSAWGREPDEWLEIFARVRNMLVTPLTWLGLGFVVTLQ